MNHHLPTMHHGQPPIPPSRRQQDFGYNPGPPNIRSPPYMGYPPHMNGHMPPTYSPQQFPPSPWYPPAPYGHMQMPPRPYQPGLYGPMIVSSYPHSQPIMAPNHLPPPTIPMQPRTSTPLQPAMSPSVPAPPLQPEMQDRSILPVQPPHHYPVASPPPPPRWAPKVIPESKPVFVAPVSSIPKWTDNFIMHVI
jgi:ubiquitin carboxyl-terminal hydrolase 10